MLYPTDFPYESVKIVIEDIRNKAEVTDRQKFAKALWELSGYALKSTLGEPLAGDVPFVFGFDGPVSDKQVVIYLESSVATTSLPLDLIAMLPWRAILKWSLLRIAELL